MVSSRDIESKNAECDRIFSLENFEIRDVLYFVFRE